MATAAWILIAYFKMGYGAAAVVQEFNTDVSCMAAAEILEHKRGYYWAICVPK